MTSARGTSVRRGRPASLVLVAAALFALVTALQAGCADSPDIGTGVNIYTTPSPGDPLRFMVVDEELTQLAQAGQLDLENLPRGRRVYFESTGAEAAVPYVVVTDFYFTQMDVFYAEVSQAGDGFYEVFFQLNDEQGRDNSGKLAQLTAEALTAARQSGVTARLAVIFDGEVHGFMVIDEPVANGAVIVGSLSRAEADAMVLNLPDRAYRFPEEGIKSKWEQ